jgi:flagellar biosynthesis/type III secretory pathway protein FliH
MKYNENAHPTQIAYADGVKDGREVASAQAYSNGLTDGIREGQARVLKIAEEMAEELDEQRRIVWSGEVTRFVEKLKQRLEQPKASDDK